MVRTQISFVLDFKKQGGFVALKSSTKQICVVHTNNPACNYFGVRFFQLTAIIKRISDNDSFVEKNLFYFVYNNETLILKTRVTQKNI